MQAERAFYLTKEGLIKLKAEYRHLRKIKSFKTKGEFPRAWQSEDLNPEYLSLQEDLNLLDLRLNELENILKNSQLIKMPPKDKQNIVALGSTVLVEVDGQIDEFQIVGSLEANPSLGKISDKSPVGKSLLGHMAGDHVNISSPINIVYKIKKIKYKLS